MLHSGTWTEDLDFDLDFFYNLNCENEMHALCLNINWDSQISIVFSNSLSNKHATNPRISGNIIIKVEFIYVLSHNLHFF